MRASVGGRDELAARVQLALMLPTKKQAAQIVDVVVNSLEATLLNNLAMDGFTLKLGSFGKFSVRHKSGIRRRIPFTGETILTKDKRKIRFISLGALRQSEKVYNQREASCEGDCDARTGMVHSGGGRQNAEGRPRHDHPPIRKRTRRD
jgi:nucleoid DNA-binding protein